MTVEAVFLGATLYALFGSLAVQLMFTETTDDLLVAQWRAMRPDASTAQLGVLLFAFKATIFATWFVWIPYALAMRLGR